MPTPTSWYRAAQEALDREQRRDPPAPVHTVNGVTDPAGWPYGTKHDMDCPACVASGAPFTASPRSETYWAS